MALRGANTKSNILLLGEVGVGKTLLAENIHNSSEYGEDRFIKIKGNRVNQEFLEVLEGRGTLYIEEVSKLDEKAQEALIEFLDSDRDYRLITSTSENLDEMVISKNFDENLYYKINIFPIYIPPLRERQGDIELLIDYLLPKICKKAGLEEKRISLEGMNLIKEYTWPDNIKELINVLERGVNLALGPNILTKHIVLLGDVQRVEEGPKTLKEELELREKVIIQSTLALNNGDKKKTMKDLDISQSTLYEKLKKYDLN